MSVHDSDQAVVAISGAELFSGLSQAELLFLSQHGELVEFADEDLIFDVGDTSDALWVVQRGEVEILGPEIDRHRSLLARLVQGEAFGELELWTQKRRGQRALSLGSSSLFRIPARGQSWTNLIEASPILGASIVKSFLKLIAGRTRLANQLAKDNSLLVKELRRQVYGDRLTGLFNKTYLDETLPSLVGEAPLALFLLKPDNFKEINDTWGHDAGDATLRLMATRLARFSASLDNGCWSLRYQGNELGLVLPRIERSEATRTANALREELSQIDLRPVTGEPSVTLSVSVGVALAPEHAHEAESLIALAHTLPLVGRSLGGNRVIFPEDTP